MQKVSREYRNSMSSGLRERAYTMISFGLVNQEIQGSAKVDSGQLAYYSKPDDLFIKNSAKHNYATLEENFTRVDGSMLFLPRNEENCILTELVSYEIISKATFELIINLNVQPTDFKGFTIEFGENYPLDFDLITDSGQKIEVRNNNKTTWVTQDVFSAVTRLRILFYKMKNLHSRVRIYSILFGYGLIYYNDDVISSTLESHISPIAETIPQIDFTLQLKNYNRYFDVDNPDSAINFLETGQELNVYYGYQLPDSEKIEWIKGNKLWCSSWESNKNVATIRCQDVFRNLDVEFYKGKYFTEGVSFYDLAIEVLRDARVDKYSIDPRLKLIKTQNPIPRVSHKEALQLIANATRCILAQTRDGKIIIKSNFIPNLEVSCNGETSYSNINNIIDVNSIKEYSSMAYGYTTVDGEMYFPNMHMNGVLHTGYVSNMQSSINCRFIENPIIELRLEAAFTYYGLKIEFGNALPSEFIIRTYNNNNLVKKYVINKNISKTMTLVYDFDDFDVMKIEFVKTQNPYNRIIVNHIELGDITDFEITKRDVLSPIITLKQELIKEVKVPYYDYKVSNKSDNLIKQDVQVFNGKVETFYFKKPYSMYSHTLNGSGNKAVIVDSGAYYITIRYLTEGSFNLLIVGFPYEIVENFVTVSINNNGKTIKWANPLICNSQLALELANWLKEYYSSLIEYDYNIRGNPELDVNDVIYQTNDFTENMRVNLYHYVLDFKQSFSGKVKTRRLGG